jgi:hypothetical protein
MAHGRVLVLVMLVFVGSAISAGPDPVAAGGGPYVFPGCGITLQACVDAAEGGATIYIDADTVDEGILIEQSLTLAAAQGRFPRLLVIVVVPATPMTNVTLDHLRSSFGIRAAYDEGTSHALTIRRSRILGSPSTNAGIEVNASVPVDVVIERTFVRSDGDQLGTVEVHLQGSPAAVTLRAVGNTLTQRGADNGGGGILFDGTGGAHLRADLMNNVIWDTGRCECGANGGIAILLDGAATADVNVVGDTVERGQGAAMDVRVQDASLRLDVFDSIFSHHSLGGIDVDKSGSGTLTFRGGFNDLFKVGGSQVPGGRLGPGTLKVDPRFVDRAAGNLRLKASSPLIDSGQVCTPGGLADPDAAGNHRLTGGSVDIGAYERAAKTPTGTVLVGTNAADSFVGTGGNDILCGYGGSDFLSSAAGNDYLDGGHGADQVQSGPGPDRLFGRDGNDLLCARDGTGGNDRLDGGPGRDRWDADPGDVRTSLEQHLRPCGN